ncbi:MAG: TonB-dependent receptor [Pseudomonadota bacterium]
MFTVRPLSVAISATLGFSLADAALAQDDASVMEPRLALEEVLVTARKRSESLFDVPGAVSAVSPDTLESLRMNDARDLLTLVPTAFLSEGVAGTARDVNIRGIGTPNLFAESGVATYIDEVYSSGYISYPTQFYDVERIEILRGPQGALYGRNAVGGAMNVISHRADPEFGGRIRGSYARYDRTELEGTVNVPFSSSFAGRFTGWYTDQEEGEYFNPAADEYIDANDSKGLRGVFSWTPTEDLSIDLVIEDTEAEAAGTALYFPGDGERKGSVARDDHPRNEWDTTRIAAIGSYSTDLGEFTVVLGSRDYELDGVEDTDLTADNPFDLLTGQLGKQTLTRTNEVESDYLELRWLSPQWGNVDILAGINLLDESATGFSFTDLPDVSQNFSGGTLPANLALNNDQELESWAVFAELTWAFSDTWDAILSARYTEDEKSVDFAYEPSVLISSILGAAAFADETRTFDNFSPGITLNWAPTDVLRVYAKIQTGFRAGGYNFNVGSIDNLAYDEETSINYEIGSKYEFWDGRAKLAASFFLLEQEDVLVPLFDLTVPGPLGGYLDNVAEAETYGVEVEASALLTEGFTTGIAVGWLDAAFTEGMDSFGNDLDGNQLPASRDWTFSLTGNYRKAINDSWQILSDFSFTYRDEGFTDVQNQSEVSDAELLNLSLGFDFNGLIVQAYGRNLLDDDYDLAFGVRAPASLGVISAEGRTYGINVQYVF